MTIKNKYLLIVLSLIIIPQILLTAIVYFNNKEQLNEEGKIRLKNQAKMTIELIASMNTQVQNGVISLDDAKEEVRKRLLGVRKSDGTRDINRNFDLGENGYIFILNEEGKLLAHPTIEERNLWDTKDEKGNLFVQEIIKHARESDGGYTYYNWELPNSSVIEEKITYSIVDPYWGWIISPSTYLMEFNKPADDLLKKTVLTLILVVLIDIIVVFILLNKFTRPILQLTSAMRELVVGNLNPPAIDINRKDEIGAINRTYADLVNGLSQLVVGLRAEVNKNYVADSESTSESLVQEILSIHEETQKHFRLYGRMFENASEGIMISDEKGHVVDINPAFTKVTGYERDEVIGKSPRILQSGKHDMTFYIELWAAIHENGQWRGEIWNKRKNGEVYPELLSINVVKSENGSVTNYIAIFTDITEQKKSEENLSLLAYYDTLTGLPNRNSFYKKLDYLLKEAQENKTNLAILFLDINRFKYVNDTLGHSKGDRLIEKISKRLTECKLNDIEIFRLGGDEFIIILSNIRNIDLISHNINCLLESFKKPFNLEEKELFVTTSIGVSVYPDDGNNAEILLKNADTAMYRAKEERNNNFIFYNSTMNETLNKKMVLENALRKAIENEEFTLYYQPQYDLQTKNLIGAEALVRWIHPEYGIVSPMDFISIAEETGLIVQLGQWVLRRACMQNKEWEAEGFDPIKLSVNVSAFEFKNKEFVANLVKTLKETKLDFNYLDLEITESISMYDFSTIISTLEEIKSFGITLSIDDFGTGHSSLSYLKKFPINNLKIDRSFVKNLANDQSDQAIVSSIITLAHDLNLKVIAEGVETDQELSFLSKCNCDIVQGYLLGKPMPANEFEKLLHND